MIILVCILAFAAGCSQLAAFMSGASDEASIQASGERPGIPAVESDPLTKLAYIGGTLVLLAFGTFVGAKYIPRGKDEGQ